jgi:hypothetical protein
MRDERKLRVFENRVMRRICGPKRDEVKGVRRQLKNKALHYLYSSPTIVGVIKSRIRWAGHVARLGGGERRVHGFGGETRGKETTWETQT